MERAATSSAETRDNYIVAAFMASLVGLAGIILLLH